MLWGVHPPDSSSTESKTLGKGVTPAAAAAVVNFGRGGVHPPQQQYDFGGEYTPPEARRGHVLTEKITAPLAQAWAKPPDRSLEP